jgi:NADPH:quinone reductase-like Zn-dependent oxidoreductase
MHGSFQRKPAFIAPLSWRGDCCPLRENQRLSEIVQLVRDGRLRTNIDKVATLDAAVATFNSKERRSGKTVIRVRP